MMDAPYPRQIPLQGVAGRIVALTPAVSKGIREEPDPEA